MNCKPGDLAVFVHSTCGNEGKIVTCVEFVGEMEFLAPWGRATFSDCWQIYPSVNGCRGAKTEYIPDEYLRPLRDNGGEDQTLTWAGKPESITAPEAV